jgi:predicted phage replisome organizer
MAEKRYYWLKLKNDFFTDKRIKKLRKIAGGNTYTVIYLKMQLLSLQEEGYIYFDNVEDTFEEEIALQIDEDVEDVKITIKFLLDNGLIKQTCPNRYDFVETMKCIGSETRNAESMRKLREKRKKVTLLPNVTNCYTEKEIEKDKDKEKDKKKNIEKKKYFENEELNNIFLEFLQIRKKLKAVNSERAIKMLINKLSKYDDDKIKYKMIEKSILNSWKDVYELKKEDLEPTKWFNEDNKIKESTEEEKEELENLINDLGDL